MDLAGIIISRSRLFLSIALLLSLVGVLSWFTMPRQEDPSIPARAALIVVPVPGASARTVERLVLEPLEDALGEVDQIRTIHGTARTNAAVVVVELRDEVRDVEPVYDEVERQLRLAEAEFPDTVGRTIFDRRLFDQESILIAIHGEPDPLKLRDAAEQLRHQLLGLSDVSRVIVTADPGEQVTVALHDTVARRLGLDPRLLSHQLATRNTATPGGTISLGDRMLALEPTSEFATLDELNETPIALPSGATLPLHELARVELGPQSPATDRMRHNGTPAMALGVVPRDGIHLVRFGDDVARVVAEFDANDPVEVSYIAFQPSRVEARLEQLGNSLLSGIAIVAAVLFVFMGVRLGVTVASVVPLVTLSALGIYAMAGGLLHQMSIAALVLALGLLVDAAIVLAEDVQARLDRGAGRWQAARDAIATLAVPLGAATGTTVAAFVPMLLAVGPTGDFTRALPIVIITTLAVSYVYAVTVTPAIAALLLQPSPQRAARPTPTVLRQLVDLPVRRPWWIIAGAVVLVAGALSLAPKIRMQFFPASDRNEFIVDVVLPEGAHLDATDAAASVLEDALLAHPRVVAVATFVGRGVPHFYYNLAQKPQRPHLAQLIVTTSEASDVDPLLAELRDIARRELPGISVIGQRIEQGPPVAAPIEIRVFGDDLAALARASAAIRELVRQAEGAVDVRSDLSLGVPTLRYDVHDAIAARNGLTRDDVALALLGQTRGIPVGELRYGDDPIPVVVRGPYGEHTPPSQLAYADVSAPGVPPTPLAQLASETVEMMPAALPHRDRQRTVSVFAQLAPGATFSEVIAQIEPGLANIPLEPGMRLEIGGDAEASGDSNAAMLRTLPFGLLLLLVFLIGEFNSFRGVAIVMATVPLAAVGIVPGLVLTDQPFGFMSMLGVFALIGIVVNNAIVLLDVIGISRAAGATVADAVRGAVLQRIRPILLTTGTTVAGLLPLAFSDSTMWPPLAWSMVSGLLASTLLTLLVIPSLYRVMHR